MILELLFGRNKFSAERYPAYLGHTVHQSTYDALKEECAGYVRHIQVLELRIEFLQTQLDMVEREQQPPVLTLVPSAPAKKPRTPRTKKTSKE